MHVDEVGFESTRLTRLVIEVNCKQGLLSAALVEAIQTSSRRSYGRPLEEIEADFASLLNPVAEDLGATGRRRRAAS